MAFAVFGPGSLYVTRTDVANSTPVNIGFAQEFSLDEAGTTKSLYGQNQYPLASARGTIKASGKAVAAELSGIAINSVFHGASFSAGQLLMAQSVAGTLVSTTFTPTVPNSGTFDTDLGVLYAATGLPLTKVASGPAQGQYSVSGGNYTFNTADEGAALLFTFAYSVTGSGQTKIVTNTPIGSSPTFQLDYATQLEGKSYYLRIYQSVSSKLSQTFKLEDFMMPNLEFDIFANSAGNVYKASYADVG